METKNIPVGSDFYSELLQGCVYERALFLGRQIHGLIVKKGREYAFNQYIETKLVIFYAKCDEIEMADRLFLRTGAKNVFSWAAMIGLYSRLGLSKEALWGYCDMLENGVFPDNFVVPNVLKACGASHSVSFGRGIHGYAQKVGFGGCVYVASSLVDMYGKCGFLSDAEKVFDKMSERNVVAWNSLIVGYFQNGMHQEAIKAFYDMRVEDGVEPTRVTLSSFLSASANLRTISEGKQAHAMSILLGLSLDFILGSSILSFYSKIGLIEDSELVFMRMVEKDVVTWNLLISSYIQHGLFENALDSCHLMRSENLRFDCVTLKSILSAAAKTSDLSLGKVAHCYCIRNHFDSELVVVTSIVDMYTKCERVMLARQAFEISLSKDLVLWNMLLAAYGKLGLSGEALKLFYKMQLEGLTPDVVSYNSLILGLLQNGQVNEAKEIFSQMKDVNVEQNLVTWTTLISGLVQNGFFLGAVSFFREMQACGIKPDNVALNCVLSAFMDTKFLQLGREAHGYVTRRGFFLYGEAVTSLEEMYVRCGRIDEAKRVCAMTQN